ncbi:MAG: protein kinase [Anaerolineae bacterium]|nr:protein kinase [Anaerolineae bacterium]
MLQVGAVLQGRYRIAGVLGQGGMGAVYRAWDTRLQVQVALKEMVPQPGLAPQVVGQLRQQFAQEATVLARLHHPNLVRVTDYFEEQGNVHLVMDFVEGESLHNIIVQQGAIAEGRVLVWARQLLGALEYCHQQGILHRDIKPQNVIIRADGQALLVDFGLVKLWDPRDPHTHTVVRGMGSPEYAPPEQYSAQSGHTDARSDIYGLAATLYHALTGQAPPTATERIVQPRGFLKPRQVVPAISAVTEMAILNAMQMQPDMRYPSIAAFRQALFAESTKVMPPDWQPDPVQPVMSQSEYDPDTQRVGTISPQPSSRNWLGLAVAGIFLLIGATVVGTLVLSGAFESRTYTVTPSMSPSPTTIHTAVPSNTPSPIAPSPTFEPTKAPPNTQSPDVTQAPHVYARYVSEPELQVLTSIWNFTTFRDLMTPGTRTYEINVSPRDDLRWAFEWCATDESGLEVSLSPLVVQLLIDGVIVPGTDIFEGKKTTADGWKCHYWATALSGWQKDTSVQLEINYNLVKSVCDGKETYPAGEYRQIIYAYVN